GSGLMVQLPSGSSAIMQTNGYPSRCAGFPGCNNLTISGLIKQGGVDFVPFSGQPLQFVNSGADPTTLQVNGLLVTGTISAPTTVGSNVTLFSNNAPLSIMVQNNTFFNNGVLTSSCPTATGFAEWRALQIGGNGGTLTLDGIGGIINLTGIPSPTIPNGPAGPVAVIGGGATSTTFNKSLTINLTPLAFVIINANGGAGGPVNLGADVTLTVHGGGALPSGAFGSSGQSFAFFAGSLVFRPTVNFWRKS